MHWTAKTYWEKTVCLLTAAAVFFCALVPAPGLCDCNDCPYVNSECSADSESYYSVQNHSAPNCCQPVSGFEHSDTDFCVCACARPATPILSAIDNTLLRNDLQSQTPMCFALPTAFESIEQPTSCSAATDLPFFGVSVRLHLILSVMLV